MESLPASVVRSVVFRFLDIPDICRFAQVSVWASKLVSGSWKSVLCLKFPQCVVPNAPVRRGKGWRKKHEAQLKRWRTHNPLILVKEAFGEKVRNSPLKGREMRLLTVGLYRVVFRLYGARFCPRCQVCARRVVSMRESRRPVLSTVSRMDENEEQRIVVSFPHECPAAEGVCEMQFTPAQWRRFMALDEKWGVVAMTHAGTSERELRKLEDDFFHRSLN